MELTDYIRIVRKRWIMITLLALLTTVGAGVLTTTMVPVYQATTQLFVSVSSEGTTASDLNAGNSFISQRVKSYAQSVRTAAVLRPVIKSIGLVDSVGDLAGRVTASSPLDTVILNVSVTDTDPMRAAVIANAIGSTLPQVVDEIERLDTQGRSPVKLSTLQPASAPTEPISPRPKLNLALGLLAGLAIGMALALLIHVLDTKVHSARDIERVKDLAILGVVPRVGKKEPVDLIVAERPQSQLAEAFRAVRTNTRFVLLDRANSFVVTSPGPSEGKTTVATNLAIAVAQSGTRVLCVDADLRRPQVANVFGVEGSVGLTDVLVGRVDVADAIQPWPAAPGLDILPAGSVPPNPSEMLGSREMRDLVAAMEQDYGLVVFDCSPMLPVTDPLTLSGLVGGTILVAACGQTHRPSLDSCLKAITTVSAHLLGVILTKAPTKGADAYGYAYGYGYGYGSYSSASTPGSASVDDGIDSYPEDAEILPRHAAPGRRATRLSNATQVAPALRGGGPDGPLRERLQSLGSGTRSRVRVDDEVDGDEVGGGDPQDNNVVDRANAARDGDSGDDNNVYDDDRQADEDAGVTVTGRQEPDVGALEEESDENWEDEPSRSGGGRKNRSR
ncbi:MAG: polysaccharide biosynthesis tyrosine autokinase [Bifidobacteriaceae bacterium]|nr:polysaccharide biosynthesis tyrosine autokinase [Bifidobacteriaceae bacterium]